MEQIKLPKVKLPKQIEEYRSQMVDQLLASPSVIEFLKTHDLDESFVADHVVELMQLEEENRPCLACPGYPACPKQPKGFLTSIEDDITYVKCPKFLEIEKLIDNYADFDVPSEDWYYASLENIAKNTQRRSVTLAAAKWLREPKNNGLYIHGNGGVGKSYIMTAIVNEYIRTYGNKVSFVNVRSFLEDIKDVMKENPKYVNERREALRSVPLLVLDDLGAERVTAWSCNVIYDIIDYRYQRNIPTCYTSRYSIEELKDIYGEQRMDRIADIIQNRASVVEVKGLNLAKK